MTLPKKLDFCISQNEVIADLQDTNNELILNEIIQAMRSTVISGGRVVLEETYDGEPSINLAEYITLEAVNLWVDEMNKLRSELGLRQLGQ